MERALFANISNKTNRIRLKIEKERSTILKKDEDIKLPIRTITFAAKHPQEILPAREVSAEKGKLLGKQHVRFKIDRSKTVKDETQEQPKQQRIRAKKLTQPKRKIINCFSTSKLIRLTKMDSQGNESEEQNVSQSTEYKQLNEIVELLKNRYLLFQTGVMNYSIKKEDFVSLLFFFVASLTFPDSSKCKNYLKLKFGKYSVLQQKLANLHKMVMEQMEQSLNILAVESNIIDFTYDSDVYAMEQKVASQKLTKMTEQLSKISKQLTVMREDKDQLMKLMKNMKSELSHHLKQKADLETQLYQLKDLNIDLDIEIKQKKKFVSLINQEAQNIFNYLNSDNCKRIERISVQYKEIQKEMHQYALQLQSNHMTREIGYQPRPFAQIEEVIVDQMKRINKTIIQDVEILPQLKQKLMRNFILRAMDKFKSKDLQMSKLNEFKTKCIRTYIQNIKKWLQNWTLKQEYLVNMRKQFIYDSQKLGEKLKKLKFILNEGSILQISNLVQEVHHISEKIIENYKLGNSFY